MNEIINEQRRRFKENGPISLKERLFLIRSLEASLRFYERDVYAALYDDLHKDEWEVFTTELSIVYEEIRFALKHLKKWVKPEKIKTALIQFPARNFVIHEPFGQVLIMSPWNYPLQLTLLPVIGALAAGNYVVIKPSAYAPSIAEVMKNIIERAFPNNEAVLFLGGRQVNEAILEHRYDMIFFTGSPSVGKIVMQKASEHLTPLVLELGGKSPAIILDDADFAVTLRRLKFGKLINNGQTCVAPDYVLITEQIARRVDELADAFTLTKEEQKRLPKIVNEKHYERLKTYLDELKILRYDDKTKTILPTVIINPPLDSSIMQEEIFGPLLPVIIVKDVQAAINFVNEREKPLALYLFTKSKKHVQQVLQNTSSGSVAINDCVIQLANPHFPFGGVGNSGMGSYHGHHTYRAFSHRKAVLHKSTKLDFRFRYKQNDKALRLVKKMLRLK